MRVSQPLGQAKAWQVIHDEEKIVARQPLNVLLNDQSCDEPHRVNVEPLCIRRGRNRLPTSRRSFGASTESLFAAAANSFVARQPRDLRR